MKLIARYFQLEKPNVEDRGQTDDEVVEEVMRATNMTKRSVRLTDAWWKDSDGPLLATLRDGSGTLALFPGTVWGLYFLDATTNKKIRVTKKNAALFDEDALCFYRPLPARALTEKEFLTFLISQMRRSDLLLYFLAFILMSVAGIVSTIAVKIAFDHIIPSGAAPLLLSLFLFLASLALANLFMRSALHSLSARIQCRLSNLIENSVIARVMNLPVSFFGNNTAGGLSQRITAFTNLSKTIADILFVAMNMLVALVMSLPILYVAPQLLPAGLIAITLAIVVYIVTTIQEQNLTMRAYSQSEKNGGVAFDLISGAQRLKLSGSEDRAYARWLYGYAEQAAATYSTKFPLCARAELVTICRLIGPRLEMGEPILQAVPEYGTGKTLVSELSGRIELNHVTFRYEEDGPAVLDDLSLTIQPGEYVGIVGRSGCGKSTLVKMLLGFETPQEGTVCYDEYDTSTTNLRSLRRCIGTVLQDGKLFAGDIYSNITITAPYLGVEDAWDAAEKVGMAEDIRRMPMGMHTLISEGSGGISGGQKQRLMIARAIVGKPKILIMDEATSALDNLTQKTVTDSLDALDCTRIVIAHRLSTIRSCDRILALDKGKIVESGSYDELMEKDGFFAELVKRQQIDEG